MVLENLLDDEAQAKIKTAISNITFTIKFYCIIITILLLLNVFYMYLIYTKIELQNLN